MFTPEPKKIYSYRNISYILEFFSIFLDNRDIACCDTNPPIACRISFWSVPAIVFRLFPLGLRGRDLLFTIVSWVSGPDSRDLLLIDILSKPRPLTSTATISAGNLRWITLSRSLSVYRRHGILRAEETKSQSGMRKSCIRQPACLTVSTYIYWTVISTICRPIKGSNGVLGWTAYLSAIAWTCSSGLGSLWSTASSLVVSPRILDAQSGGTVTSPRASADVHLRRSSIAAGYKSVIAHAIESSPSLWGIYFWNACPAAFRTTIRVCHYLAFILQKRKQPVIIKEDS